MMVGAKTEECFDSLLHKEEEVVVIGGGPSGLLAAIVLREAEFRVKLWEKRQNYHRRIWFDVYSEPWSFAIGWLDRLGFFDEAEEGKDFVHHQERSSNTMGVTSLQCSALENFLLRAARRLGVEIIHEEATPEKMLREDSASWFIDASGSGSIFPEASGVSRKHVSYLEWHGDRVFLDTSLSFSQISWLAELKSCSSIQLPENQPFYPHSLPGLDSLVNLYQRNFGTECEVQALFRNEIDDESSARKVISRLLESYASGVEILHEQFIKIEIKHLKNPVGAKLSNAKPILFVGDSAVNSYYRLGIGLYKTFDELNLLSNSLTKNITLEEIQQLLHELQETYAVFQTTAMAIETNCHKFIGFSLDGAHSIFEAGSLLHFDRRTSDFIDVTFEDLKTLCFEEKSG